MEIVWLRSAVKDLERLQQFIQTHNPKTAKNVAQKIKQAVAHLYQSPELGKPVEDLPEFRDLAIPFGAAGYILRYRCLQACIYIVHIRHYREETFVD